MVGFTRAFHNDLRQGFDAVNIERFPWLEELKQAPWSGVLCLGMGGSAAGGDFLAALTSHEGGCPLVVHRDYTLPAWFDPTWLVLARVTAATPKRPSPLLKRPSAVVERSSSSPPVACWRACPNSPLDAT